VHELGIAQQIVELACEGAPGARVTRIVVVIGKLSMVLPDALRFCFDLATEHTAAEGARLEIVETPGAARCRACNETVPLDRPFGRCVCTSTDLEWTSGEELEIREVEVA
jgi:hydrogenase nickel incorporation protein HypA/HybF